MTMIQSLEQIYELFPSMRHSKQAPKLPRMCGTWGFDGEAEWRQFVQTIPNLRLRVPSAGEPSLCGPFLARGDCLEPYSREGDLCWFDPTVEPADGDFVLVAWTEEYLASRQGKGMLDGWREQYGFEAGVIATKRLSRMGPSWMLQVRSGYFDLENIHGRPNARILGVLRRIERDGRALYQDPPDQVGHIVGHAPGQRFPSAPLIELNAATTVYETTAAGPVNIISLYGGIYVVTQMASGWEAVATATGRYVMNISAAAPCELRGSIVEGTPFSPAVTQLVASNQGNVTGNVKGLFTLERRFPFNGNTVQAYTLALEPIFNSPANVGSSVDLYDIRFKVEVIKR